MRKFVISSILKLIRKYQPDYDEPTINKIKYGLESIYIFVTKTVFIFFLAFLLDIVLELFIFMALYNIIRMPSFGLHASKSWICLVFSTTVFLTSTYLCQIIKLPIIIKGMVGIICILLIFKNAPADTHKRPIVSKKRREVLKFISTIIAIIFVIIAFLNINNFVSNSLIFTLVIQCFMISPLVYRLFKLPYNNYLKFATNTN
jgi:accessory gene regulator B